MCQSPLFECTISPSLFVLAMQILLKVAGSNIPEAHIGKGVYMPPIKAFMDDTTLIMLRKKVVQNTLDKLNNLLGLRRMAFKPAKSRSLALVRGKIRRDVFFNVAEQRIPTVSEEPVKSLGRVFDESLTDKSMRGAILQQIIEGLQVIEAAQLQGRFKVWLLQFVLLPRLLWSLTSVQPVAVQGQFAEVAEFDGRHQMRALWRNRDIASRAQQLHIYPCQWSVHMAT